MEVVQRRQAYKPSCHQFDAQPLCRHWYRKMWIVSLMAQSLWITSVLCCEVLLLIVVEYGRIVSLITGKSKSGCSFIAWGVWNTTICSWPWCKIFCCMCSMWGESMLDLSCQSNYILLLHEALHDWGQKKHQESQWVCTSVGSRFADSNFILKNWLCIGLLVPSCIFIPLVHLFFTVLLFQKTFYPFKIKGKFSDYL